MDEKGSNIEELVRIAEMRKQEIRERLRNRQRLESDLPVTELSPAEREADALVAKEVWKTAMRILNDAVETRIPQDESGANRVELRRSNAIDHKLYPEQVDLVATDYSFSTLQSPTSRKPTHVRHEEEFAFYSDRVIKTTRESLFNISKIQKPAEPPK